MARGPGRMGSLLAGLVWLLGPSTATAQLAPGKEASAPAGREAPGALDVVVDADDSDRDGTADQEQPTDIPGDALVTIPSSWLKNATTLSLRGNAVRFVRAGQPLTAPVALAPELEAPQLQGVREGVAHLQIEAADASRLFVVHAVRMSLLDGHNTQLPATAALRVSHHITNDDSLPRQATFHTLSPDPHNLRVELDAPPLQGLTANVELSSHAHSGGLRDTLALELRRADPSGPLRSHFVRLVGDAVDRQAPGVAGHALRVSLRDRVQVSYTSPGGAVLRQSFFVAPSVDTQAGDGALTARMNIFVLRAYPGGPPVIGRDDLSAVRIAQRQVDAANEVWLQCGIGFGDGAEAAIALVAPPPPSLLAIADGDGLPAAGGGEIHLRVGGLELPVVKTVRGATPLDTAFAVAAAVRKLGFHPRVTQNPRTQYGHGPSADVQVLGKDGQPVLLEPLGELPLSSDRRQRVHIGKVDVGDGIEEFDNMNARAGTLEERALIKAFADDDPSTIELFIINRFENGTRQGEAFIESGAGSVVNTLLIDRNGLRQQPTAWTLAHEIGHILLDQPLHPDNVGPDRPWQLMDSDSSRGTVYGPKRLDAQECARARHQSGPGARPQLLWPLR